MRVGRLSAAARPRTGLQRHTQCDLHTACMSLKLSIRASVLVPLIPFNHRPAGQFGDLQACCLQQALDVRRAGWHSDTCALPVSLACAASGDRTTDRLRLLQLWHVVCMHEG